MCTSCDPLHTLARLAGWMMDARLSATEATDWAPASPPPNPPDRPITTTTYFTKWDTFHTPPPPHLGRTLEGLALTTTALDYVGHGVVGRMARLFLGLGFVRDCPCVCVCVNPPA